MRIKAAGKSSYSFLGITEQGGEIPLALTLAQNPVQPLEAATKAYVDFMATNIDAAKITGIFPLGRLPIFDGVDVYSTGMGVFTLRNTTVSPGTYTKVTVDVKGRVTAGGNITEAEIPSFSFAKLVNLPTTLAGYGILDGVSLNGATLSGPLFLNNAPLANEDAANKQYVDNTLLSSNSSAFEVGDVVMKATTTTPIGFLKTNGAFVSKTSYADLWNKIGNTFRYYGTPGFGSPGVQQYFINSLQKDPLTGWTSVGPTNVTAKVESVIPTASGQAILFQDNLKQRLVNIDGSGEISPMFGAEIEPFVKKNATVVVVGGFLLVVGGRDVSNTTLNTISHVNLSGVNWSTVTPTDTTSQLYRFHPIVFATRTKLYIMGGFHSTSAYSNIVSANIGNTGTASTTLPLGEFKAEGNLPSSVGAAGVAVTKNRVYLLGITRNTNYAGTNETIVGDIDANGNVLNWRVGPNLPTTIGNPSVVTTKNRVYLIGGTNSSGTHLNTVYSAPIKQDGSLGTWTTDTEVPATGSSGISGAGAIVTSNYLYVIGGTSASSVYTKMMRTPFLGGKNDYSTENSAGYADLFDVLPGNGRPWEYILHNSGNPGALTEHTMAPNPLPFSVGGHFLTKNRVFFMEAKVGFNGPTRMATAEIGADGIVGAITIMPANFSSSSVISAHFIVMKNMVIAVCQSYYYNQPPWYDSTARDYISKTTINPDGTISAWTESSMSFDSITSNWLVTKNKIFQIGRYRFTSGSVYTNPGVNEISVSSDGTIGSLVPVSGKDLSVHARGGLNFTIGNNFYIRSGVNGVDGWTDKGQSISVRVDEALDSWTVANTANDQTGFAQPFGSIVAGTRIYTFGQAGSAGLVKLKTSISTPPTDVLSLSGQMKPWFITSSRIYTDLTFSDGKYLKFANFNGENDYSKYYSLQASEKDISTTFPLPDTTDEDEANNVTSYIKH